MLVSPSSESLVPVLDLSLGVEGPASEKSLAGVVKLDRCDEDAGFATADLGRPEGGGIKLVVRVLVDADTVLRVAIARENDERNADGEM